MAWCTEQGHGMKCRKDNQTVQKKISLIHIFNNKNAVGSQNSYCSLYWISVKHDVSMVMGDATSMTL